MRSLLITFSVCLIMSPHSIEAQNLYQSAFTYDRAIIAWDSGDYPKALELFGSLLNVPGEEEYLEKIALITGELYQTQEVAPNGRSIKISPP